MSSSLIELNKNTMDGFERLFVVGDLHGDSCAFSTLLQKVDLKRDGILFLGDYADRGVSGVEILENLASLRKNNPNNVFLLKGNHEDYSENGVPLFYPCTLRAEVEKKRGNWKQYFSCRLKPFFQSLSLAAIIPGHFLFVHGGISSKISSADNLRNPSPDIEKDILWSDPFCGHGEKSNSKRGGAGVEFGFEVSASVCMQLGIERIMRSHEPQKALKKPLYMHNRRVVTISSTNVYGGCAYAISLHRFSRPFIHVLKLDAPIPL